METQLIDCLQKIFNIYSFNWFDFTSHDIFIFIEENFAKSPDISKSVYPIIDIYLAFQENTTIMI